jgi:hypothetical protein
MGKRASNQDQYGRYHRPKKYSTWIKIQAECVWCGDDFFYYSPLNEDRTPKRSSRYCGQRCVAESRWEGKATKVNSETVLKLYLNGWAITKIADHLKVYRQKIHDALKALGVARRKYTSVRSCKVPGCGKPVEKRFHHRRAKDGTRILFGTRCKEHRLAYYRDWQRNKALRIDPLRGTRKTGRKGIPRSCPKCGTPHATTRLAMACCKTDWRVFKKMLQRAETPVRHETP